MFLNLCNFYLYVVLCIKFVGVDWNPSYMIVVPVLWILVYVGR
jgi:hypothetical protein